MPVVSEVDQASIPVAASDDGLMIFVNDRTTGKWCWDIYDGVKNQWRSINCKTNIVTPPPFCDTVIFTEDFSGYILNTGRNARVNSGNYPSGVTWAIDDSSANVGNQNNDYAYTNASEEFELNNTDGAISFTTALVNISGFATVCFSIDIRGEGNLEYDPSLFSTDATNNQNDYVDVEYAIDGGMWQKVINYNNNGTTERTLVAPLVSNGTFPNDTVSVSGLAGTTISIRITSNTWAADEKFYYDNIIIKGGN